MSNNTQLPASITVGINLTAIDDYGTEIVVVDLRRVVVDDYGAVAELPMGPCFNTVYSRWAEAGDSSI